MLKVAPSILAADFARLGDQVTAVEQAGADWIHVDVMDGRFVPPITMGDLAVKALRPLTTLPLDCHLMVVEPERQVEAFAKAGADRISVHAEACPNLHRNMQQIRDLGCSPGVAINPHTPVSAIEGVLHMVDMVLCMTVNPGWGGQSFLPEVLPKIKQVAELARRTERDTPLEIQVDGGVNADTARLCEKAGATVAVAGSYVFKSKDMAQAVRGVRGTQKPLMQHGS